MFGEKEPPSSERSAVWQHKRAPTDGVIRRALSLSGGRWMSSAELERARAGERDMIAARLAEFVSVNAAAAWVQDLLDERAAAAYRLVPERRPSGNLREPRIIEMCSEGDTRRFLCLMEIERGKITGGAFQITGAEEAAGKALVWAEKVASAWLQALYRARHELWLPDGSSWNDFGSLPVWKEWLELKEPPAE